MSFDDLAKHMASRERKTKLVVSGDPDQLAAEAARADRRMSRTRDLILGPLLFVGGSVVLTLVILYLKASMTPNPLLPPDPPRISLLSIGMMAAAGAMVIVGLGQTIRGLRGRSR